MRFTRILYGAMVGALVGGGLLGTRPAAAEDFDLNTVKRAIVAVRYADASGNPQWASGCFVDMGGVKYIIVPQHVFGGAGAVALQTLAGKKVAYGNMAAARDINLVRLEFKNDAKAPLKPFILKNRTDLEADLDATMFTVCNEGKDASPHSGGTKKILDDSFETDIAIQNGLPGSPVVDIDGQLFGIVTHTRHNVLDWDSRKPKYTEPQRRLVRLTARTAWSASGDVFLTQAELLGDIARYGLDLAEMVKSGGYLNYEALRGYAASKDKAAAYADPALSKALQSYCKGFEYALLRPELESKSKTRIYQDELRRRLQAFASLIDRGTNLVNKTSWCTAYLEEEAAGLKPFFQRLKDEFALKLKQQETELAKLTK